MLGIILDIHIIIVRIKYIPHLGFDLYCIISSFCWNTSLLTNLMVECGKEGWVAGVSRKEAEESLHDLHTTEGGGSHVQKSRL